MNIFCAKVTLQYLMMVIYCMTHNICPGTKPIEADDVIIYLSKPFKAWAYLKNLNVTDACIQCLLIALEMSACH